MPNFIFLFFFIDFSSFPFFHSIEIATWTKNHKNWHSDRGEYRELNFATFEVETKKK